MVRSRGIFDVPMREKVVSVGPGPKDSVCVGSFGIDGAPESLP